LNISIYEYAGKILKGGSRSPWGMATRKSRSEAWLPEDSIDPHQKKCRSLRQAHGRLFDYGGKGAASPQDDKS
jgi:hypothetical protein